MASLYETFPAQEARRIAKRLEFHYTPKHGSWLNMAEIEFSVLSRSCLKQRFPDEDALRREVGRNTHRVASLYETFPAQEARRIAKRLEFHYTPKHGSWLNMAEIEFSVLSRSCLKQRLPDEDALRREVGASVQERNEARVTINWRFKTQDARTKLHRLYPFDS